MGKRTRTLIVALLLVTVLAPQATAATYRPDLVVKDITWSPAHPSNGTSVKFTATIKNQGTADVPFGQTFQVQFSVDGKVVDNETVSQGMNYGQERQVTTTLSWSATKGTHQVSVRVDSTNAIQESDESNNVRTESFSVGASGPDLVVQSVAVHPSPPYAGASSNFSAVIKNQGNQDVQPLVGTFMVRFLVNGTQLGSDVPVALGLKANQTRTVYSNANWTAAKGHNTVTVVVDAQRTNANPDGQVKETDEQNNARSLNFTVQAPGPDLAIQSLSHDPANPHAGQDVTYTATIVNQGNEDAGPFTVNFTVDGSNVIGSVRVQGLPAGHTRTVTSNAWNATQGDHTVVVLADALHQVKEADETNDGVQDHLHVAPPPGAQIDLAVTDVTHTTGHAGDAITFTATVANTGKADAPSFDVSFLVDGQQVATQTVPSLAHGATVNVTSDAWTATSGSHTVKVVVDPHHRLNQTTTSDDEKSASFTIGSKTKGTSFPVPAPGAGLAVAAAMAAALLMVRRRR